MDTIEHRVAMGKAARELIELADSMGGNDAHFWECMRDACTKRLPVLVAAPPTTNIRPMDDHAGQQYGREVLGFGQYTFSTYEHVYAEDPDYLRWMADKGMALLRWLRWREAS